MAMGKREHAAQDAGQLDAAPLNSGSLGATSPTCRANWRRRRSRPRRWPLRRSRACSRPARIIEEAALRRQIALLRPRRRQRSLRDAGDPVSAAVPQLGLRRRLPPAVRARSRRQHGRRPMPERLARVERACSAASAGHRAPRRLSHHRQGSAGKGKVDLAASPPSKASVALPRPRARRRSARGCTRAPR